MNKAGGAVRNDCSDLPRRRTKRWGGRSARRLDLDKSLPASTFRSHMIKGPRGSAEQLQSAESHFQGRKRDGKYIYKNGGEHAFFPPNDNSQGDMTLKWDQQLLPEKYGLLSPKPPPPHGVHRGVPVLFCQS